MDWRKGMVSNKVGEHVPVVADLYTVLANNYFIKTLNILQLPSGSESAVLQILEILTFYIG